ncbi:MAG: Rab family GTPase [Candidatus Binatia bacterium]
MVDIVSDVPFVFLFNKADLRTDWNIDNEYVEEIEANGWDVRCTSAKFGQGVEEAFLRLGKKMLEGQ